MRTKDEMLQEGLYRLLTNSIYRYRNFQRGMEMITNQEIFLSTPDGFNDPFDCYEGLVNFKMTKTFMREYITKYVATMGITTREQRRRIEAQLLKNPESLQLEKFFKSQKEKFGVCCFTWSYKNIVLWANYADNHHGICLGFKNLHPVEKGVYGIYPVNYVSKIEQYKFSSFEDEKYWEHWLCTKSADWQYEDEVRLISKSYNGKLGFPKEALTEIFLGLSVSKDKEQDIINSLIENDYSENTKLYKMIIDKASLSLCPIELKWGTKKAFYI